MENIKTKKVHFMLNEGLFTVHNNVKDHSISILRLEVPQPFKEWKWVFRPACPHFCRIFFILIIFSYILIKSVCFGRFLEVFLRLLYIILPPSKSEHSFRMNPNCKIYAGGLSIYNKTYEPEKIVFIVKLMNCEDFK